MVTQEFLKAGDSRVFLLENGAGPGNTLEYLGLARATGIDWGLGTVTPVRAPSATRYGEYDIIGIIRGAADLAQMNIESYMQPVVSQLLRIAQKRCTPDIQVHFGQCQRPDDPMGWTIIRILEAAHPTNFSTTELGSLRPDDEAPIQETLNFGGERLYDVKQIRPQELATADITDPIVDIVICDQQTCGSCGIASDGCQVVFALGGPVAGSPGLPSELLYTTDGGVTWASTNITTLGLAEAATALACVGTNLVVVSESAESLSYAPLADIVAGVETWTEVTTGFVATKGPLGIFALGATLAWIPAEGGYIYTTQSPPSGVEVQHAGTLTTEDLRATHFADKYTGATVGDSNTVLVTANGGATWTLVDGPEGGADLLTVFVTSSVKMQIGTSTGKIWYTNNGGLTWIETTFPGSGSGAVRDIQFSSRNVGYMAHTVSAPTARGRILRTIDGGDTWYVLPEEAGQSMPVNDQISAIAACIDDVNVVFGGGIADNGSDGFLVKFN